MGKTLIPWIKIILSIPVPYFILKNMNTYAILFSILTILIDSVLSILNKESEKYSKIQTQTSFLSTIIILSGFIVSGYIPLWWIVSISIILSPQLIFGIKFSKDRTIVEKISIPIILLMTVLTIVFPEYKSYLLIFSFPLALSGSLSLLIRAFKKYIPKKVFGIKTADLFSYFRILMSLFGAYFIYRDMLILAGLSILLGAVSDIDGLVARITKTESKKGKLLDNMADSLLTFIPLLMLIIKGVIPLRDIIIFIILYIPLIINHLFQHLSGTFGKESSIIGKAVGISSCLYPISYAINPKIGYIFLIVIGSLSAIINTSEIINNLKYLKRNVQRKR